MNTTQKSHEEDAPNSSSLNHLPDEIILQIRNKLIDLKTLYFCHLVSKRISSITFQVISISYRAPIITASGSNPNNSTEFPQNLSPSFLNDVLLKNISPFLSDSFRSALSFLAKFRNVKTLSLEIPSSGDKGGDGTCLFKWKVVFGNRIESFLFLSPDVLLSHNDVEEEEEEEQDQEEEEVMTPMESMQRSVDEFKRKSHIAFQCLNDVIVRHRMLLYFVKDFPVLERVVISDSGRRGTMSLSGGRLDEVRGNVKREFSEIEMPVNVSKYYVPELELPVLGGVMKGVTLIVMQMDCDKDGGVSFMESTCEGGFEDEEEAAYTEAVMEILMCHRDRMMRLL